MFVLRFTLLLVGLTAVGLPAVSSLRPAANDLTQTSPETLVAVTLDDGSQLSGKLVRRRGDPRPWLRVEGVATVLMRPLPPERIVAITPLVPKPTRSGRAIEAERTATSGATDAERAHELLFGEP